MRNNNEKFLADLKKRLRALPKEEREAALNYYSEYLEEGSVEELGSVDEVARQILEQCAVNSLESTDKKGGLKTLWIVLLSVFAAPIALPLLLALAIVILALLIVFAAVVFAIAVSGGAVFLGGVVSFALCFVALPHSFVNGLMLAGSGLTMIGVGILLLIGSWCIAKAVVWVAARLLSIKVRRGRV